MILTLSKEKVGTPSVPREWSNEKQIHVPVEYREVFFNSVRKFQAGIKEESTREDYETRLKRISQLKEKYCCDTIGKVQHYHTSYLDYLSKCWADHLGVVITPDIIWYTLLSEVASLVKESSQKFCHLFTKSSEKEEIAVYSDDPVVMPLDTLIEALKKKVPTDSDMFFPNFSTSTPKSLHAFSAAFCDMCSPFYNYSMYCCNIPLVDVRGSKDDWKFLSDKWQKVANLISEIDGTASAWEVKVTETLKQLIDNFESVDFWKSIFSIRHCGSGGEIEVLGWFTKLFRKQPPVKYVENYTPHISVVKYKQLNFNKNYEMLVGIFGSRKEDDLMVPDFSYIVNEVV